MNCARESLCRLISHHVYVPESSPHQSLGSLCHPYQPQYRRWLLTIATVPFRPSAWLEFGYSPERFVCSPRQECVELGRRLAAHARQDVAVGVEGERDLRMPKTLL